MDGKATKFVTSLDLNQLPPKVKQFVQEKAEIVQPVGFHVCDGSQAEYDSFTSWLEQDGLMERLYKHDNCWLARTDPRDVARVESKTFMATPNKYDTVPHTKEGVKGRLGNWMSPEELSSALGDRLPGCMKGRTMFIIPFSMGPIGSHFSKIGIGLSDSAYVAANMRIMTRMGAHVLNILGDGDFVKCLHTVGRPLPMAEPPVHHWPCNPDRTIISHIPDQNEIISFGSGYGGNSLLDKKCFALRLACILGKREGWLAEHMLISGITNPKGEKKYICAAFPSQCGKTNMAMMTATLPGYKVECVGDDIAWLKFDSKTGQLMAINPEYGFFGVAPGTNEKTNPTALNTVQSNTIFTNVASTSDGDFYWEGLEKMLDGELKGKKITSWLDEEWTPGCGKPAAHPNARFTAPCSECPIMDPAWESPEGVPISAIIFGGRRPTGVPLVFESFDWPHGVFLGSSVSSEATAAAEYKGNQIMHDPFAMRPFFGYNFGKYLEHWLSFEKKPGLKLPKIFMVNWFRKGEKDHKFLWPGFGENSRIVDWILRRCDGEQGIAMESPVGHIPRPGSINLNGLTEKVNFEELFSIPKDFWLNECEELRNYFDQQVGEDLPGAISEQLAALKNRIDQM